MDVSPNLERGHAAEPAPQGARGLRLLRRRDAVLRRRGRLAHLRIPAELRANIEHAYYDAGHMMYVHEPSRVQQSADLADFVCAPAPEAAGLERSEFRPLSPDRRQLLAGWVRATLSTKPRYWPLRSPEPNENTTDWICFPAATAPTSRVTFCQVLVWSSGPLARRCRRAAVAGVRREVVQVGAVGELDVQGDVGAHPPGTGLGVDPVGQLRAGLDPDPARRQHRARRRRRLGVDRLAREEERGVAVLRRRCCRPNLGSSPFRRCHNRTRRCGWR